ncbi:CS domain-containing protein [Meloidogyne graminicola]|uniref:CS domain-containing protein n=1 Tax=Meloidogyne graminicola TaxID=189291 RepID=A0A8S9ZTL0_9BILA|nr:CS domain-containing protein [Meloidogyne graminicola]
MKIVNIIVIKDLRIRKLESFSNEVNKKIALSVVDIIFDFAYDFRTTLILMMMKFRIFNSLIINI